MSAISGLSISQNQQYLSQSQRLHAQSNASEEANESPAEKAAEAAGSNANILDVRA